MTDPNLQPLEDIFGYAGDSAMEIPEELIVDGYREIPSLQTLLPKHHGWPGYTYFQCTTHNIGTATREGWESLSPPIRFVIAGEKGQVDMELLVRGAAIPGEPPQSGARACGVDKMVEEITGIHIPVLHATIGDEAEKLAPQNQG